MDIAREVLEGDRAAGARLISWLEEGKPEGIEALKILYPQSGRAYLVGMTGPPGAGKSTLVDGMVAELRRRELRVGVIAVDPTSPFSGGALLGDRVRMQRHATDPGVFVRSMATRGRLGGLSRSTFEAVVVLDAMGHDVVLVETVGVGQDELEVVELAHTTAVVCVPGLGDEVQTIKAGILEAGDLFVLNKADRPGAEEAERQLRAMLQLREAQAGGWSPPLLRTVASSGEGIAALVDACFEHRDHLAASHGLDAKAASRGEHFFADLLRHMAAEKLLDGVASDPEYVELARDVRDRVIDPYSAAERLVARFEPRFAEEKP